MKNNRINRIVVSGKIVFSILLLSPPFIFSLAQEGTTKASKNSIDYRGQLSGWGQYSPDLRETFWFGGRYIPQLNYVITLPGNNKIDFEASANIFGDVGIDKSDIYASGRLKAYRAWVRYSTLQMEVRLGLQKINFGSAQLLRPLMWFDSMDARDPLQLTDGVWGGLFRYYFTNNTNLWFWTLFHNNKAKGWEVSGSDRLPEFGARLQLPLKQGEIALSGHFRKADYKAYGLGKTPESRVGLDLRLDRTIGFWVEGSWIHSHTDLGLFTNQTLLTVGGDYTFGIGNGLGITFEQLLFSYDRKAFAFDDAGTFSGLMLSYPLGLFDDLSAMIYYDWTNNKPYHLINWQHHFAVFDLYAIGYWNPINAALPGQLSNNRFAGKGIQIMFVWNH